MARAVTLPTPTTSGPDPGTVDGTYGGPHEGVSHATVHAAPEKHSSGGGPCRPLPGLLHRDGLRDLALLRLDALPDDVAALPLAAHGAGPGDAVHSVGNSGVTTGTLWRYTAGRVRSVYQGQILQENGLLKARIVETQ